MRYSKYSRFLLLLGDLLLINLSFFLVSILKTLNSELYFEAKLFLHLVVSVAWLVLVLFTNPYQIGRTTRFAQILRGHYTLVILHFVFSATFILFQPFYDFSHQILVWGHFLFACCLFIWRGAFVYILRIYRARGFNIRKVVICGYGELSDELLKFFRKHPEFGYKYMGTFDNEIVGPKVLGKIKDAFAFVSSKGVDEIYCCLPYVQYSQVQELIQYGEDNLVKVKLISDFRGFSYKGLQLERYDHIPVLHVTSTPLDDRKNYIIKRTFDIIFSLMVILLIFPWMFPLIAIGIKLSSPGPVFFKQKRTGKDNNSFTCYKFRTMRINGSSDVQQAKKDDARITPLGNFLRRSSIDEFPQFFNVLMGNMSVVGPRPHMLKHTEEYSKRIEKFMVRHFVKPGITGLAQAKGYRGETRTLMAMKNRVKLDRFYIENWSMLLDLKIIALTLITLVKGDNNAY